MSANLIKAANSAKEFFRAREGLSADAGNIEHLRNGFVNALQVQTTALPFLGPSDAAALSDVPKVSIYGDIGTAQIVSAIDAKMAQPRGC